MKKKYTHEQFVSAVANSFSIRSALTKMGLVEAGGNYATINRLVKEYQIDTSHWTGQAHLRGKTHNWSKKIPLQEILIENSLYTANSKLRQRLIAAKYFDKKCYSCNNTEWLGKPIPLELEHINGIHTDNRIENLTILCPNCHAFTPTYRGKNKKKA